MRFLLEADKNKSDSFKKIVKDVRAEYDGKNWNKLNSQQRYQYAKQVLKNLHNYKSLKLSESTILDYIMKHGLKSDTFKWLEKLDIRNNNLFPDTFNLVSTLIDSGKLDYREKWLYREELYDRSLPDIKYSIEALTLASNPDLQKDSQGVNKFSDEPLKPTNLYHQGRIMPVAQIRDRLNRWQTKDVEFKDTKTYDKKIKNDLIKLAKTFSKNKKKTDPEIEQTVDQALDSISANVIEETVTLLTSMGMDKKEALKSAREVYTPGDSAEKMIAEILQNQEQKIKTYANGH